VLEEVVSVITQDRNRWIDTMLTEEWGLRLESPSPTRAGLSTFSAFVLAGIVPLIPFLLGSWIDGAWAFHASVAATAVTFFLIGLAKGRIVEQSPLVAGIETLAIGGAASGLAYAVGVAFKGMAG
jgi:VIT1/CCC1 family predicted Fe2+/Mn2+ transporter